MEIWNLSGLGPTYSIWVLGDGAHSTEEESEGTKRNVQQLRL